jgi:hypothetical protein
LQRQRRDAFAVIDDERLVDDIERFGSRLRCSVDRRCNIVGAANFEGNNRDPKLFSGGLRGARPSRAGSQFGCQLGHLLP